MSHRRKAFALVLWSLAFRFLGNYRKRAQEWFLSPCRVYEQSRGSKWYAWILDRRRCIQRTCLRRDPKSKGKPASCLAFLCLSFIHIFLLKKVWLCSGRCAWRLQSKVFPARAAWRCPVSAAEQVPNLQCLVVHAAVDDLFLDIIFNLLFTTSSSPAIKRGISG